MNAFSPKVTTRNSTCEGSRTGNTCGPSGAEAAPARLRGAGGGGERREAARGGPAPAAKRRRRPAGWSGGARPARPSAPRPARPDPALPGPAPPAGNGGGAAAVAPRSRQRRRDRPGLRAESGHGARHPRRSGGSGLLIAGPVMEQGERLAVESRF